MNNFTTAFLNLKDCDIETLDSYLIDNTFHYDVSLVRKHYDCPYCGGNTILHGSKIINIHHPIITDFDGFIHFKAKRFICKDCSKTFFENNPFTFEGFKNSYAVINRVMTHLKTLDLNFTRIAELNNVSVTTVLTYLDSYVAIPRPFLPESLGIDELHSGMATGDSAYLCVLVNNVKRYPIEILNSRSKRTLNNYFEAYSKTERDKVKFVTIDMWQPYKDVCLRQFKNARIAVDPFHVVKHVCDIFNSIRINIMKKMPYNSDGYYLLKKWNWLLEVTDIDLDNEPKYNAHFRRQLNLRQLQNMLLEISEKLTDAWMLKCHYQLFNEHATPENCEELFNNILARFRSTYISEFHPFTQTLINWHQEILNSFLRPFDDRKLSNALAENVNSKLRTYLSVANGISNFTRFRKRVLLALNPNIYSAISDTLKSDKVSRTKRNNDVY